MHAHDVAALRPSLHDMLQIRRSIYITTHLVTASTSLILPASGTFQM